MAAQLPPRQQLELHKAMLDYLYHAGYTRTYNELKDEAPDLSNFQPPDPGTVTSGLLVKKWTSLLRLQKQKDELKAQLQSAREELASYASGTTDPKKQNREWLPTSTPKHVLSGHRDKINAVAFHPLYSVIASASVDATVKIWDWESGDLERTLKSHTKAVSACRFDSAGRVLATCSDDLFIKLWNVTDDYKNFATLRGHEHSISSVAFLPGDAQLISASRDHTVRVWEVSTSHCVRVLKPHTDWIRSALPSADGRLLLTCSDDRSARITDIESGVMKAEMRGHDNRIEAAVFVPVPCIPAVRELVAMPSTPTSSKVDALGISFIMTASRDKTIKLWDGLRGQCLWTFVGHDGWVQALSFHPCGRYLLSVGDDAMMRIWDLRTGHCTKKIEAHKPFTQTIEWGPTPKAEGSDDSERIINVIATGGTDQVVKIWRP